MLRQEREREEELRSIRALLNAGVLINRLPIELLAEIFMQLRDESWDNPRWFNVLRVCRHWFYVAATAPRLWRRLLVKDSTNLLRTGLARSKHVPVDVEIAPRGMYTLFPDVLSIITPHAERLRLLKLGNIPASHMAQLITFLNTSSMTALQYFQAQLPVATSEGIILREANFPRLRKLLVSNLNVVAQQSLVSRFVTLDLGVHGAPSQQSAMSIDAFLNMISSLESIEELTLSSLFIKGASSAYVPDPTKRVHLRHLRKIQLTLDAIIVRRVFDAIVIPGGFAPDNMRLHPEMVELVRDAYESGKLVAAICHAGWMLCSAGATKGRKITGYLPIKDDVQNAGGTWVDEPVVIDGNVITSRTPVDLPEFGRAIVEYLEKN